MEKEELKGDARRVVGKAQSGLGEITGDAKTQAEGKLKQGSGAVEAAYGIAKDALGGAPEAAQSAIRTASDRVQEVVRQVSSSDVGDQLYTQGAKAATAVGEQVRARPLGALLVAGAIGYALALMTSRR